MKKLFFFGFAIAAIGLSTAGAQTFTAGVGDKNKQQPTRRPPAPVSGRAVVGAIPRARRGNPIQMLNPGAPERYRGSVDDTVTYDPNNPSRITGIILVGIRW